MLHAFIHGRVQGVGFRFSACERALQLGLRGWVRNRRDGSVEVMAAGDTDALRAFEAWLHHGPPAARVERVQRVPVTGATDLPPTFEQRDTA